MLDHPDTAPATRVTPDAPAEMHRTVTDDALRALALGGEMPEKRTLRPMISAMASELLAYRALITDPLGHYLATACLVTGAPTDKVAGIDLIEGYLFYSEQAGLTPLSFVAAARQIAQKSVRWRHPVSGRSFLRAKRSKSEYRGIRFTPDFKERLALWRA